MMKVKEEEEKKAQEKIERQKRKKQEKEEMKVVKQKLEEERFREIEEYYKNQNGGLTNQKNEAEEEYEVQSEFYCQLCQKQFKSQNQLRNHQKSKQHKQNVKMVEKEVMLKQERFEKVIEEVVQKDK